MPNPNLARNLIFASSAAIACLGLTGCAGAAEAPKPPVTTQPSPDINGSDDGQLKVRQVYFPNGTRKTTFYPSGLVKKWAWCEGDDLVEQTLPSSVNAGDSIARSVGHPACADGRLTPSDFPTK